MKSKKIFLRMGTSIVILIIIVVALFVMFQNKKTSDTQDNQKLHIVAAENFWGNIASQLGGNHVDVTSIITNPNTDPHLYESNAGNASAIAHADLVIENGLGYDDFIDKLLSVSPNKGQQVLSVAKTLNISGDNPNPHMWYDIPQVPAVADAFEQALEAKDPSHKADYMANLTAFKKSLQPILDVVEKIKTKYANTPIAYTERVPGYLVAAAKLDVRTPSGFASAVEDGTDPSPSDTDIMNTLMTNHTIRVLLYNTQATSSVTKQVKSAAEQAGIPVVGVSETLPASEPTYQSWQLDQTTALLKALGN